MKGKLLLVPCLLLLLSCFSYTRFSQTEIKASSGSPVHNLNTGLNYTAIQEAIDANETLNGDTIKVDAGTYYESIIVSKSLTLVGEDRNTTIIDGNGSGLPTGFGSAEAIIGLKANGICIMNLTVRNAGLRSGLSAYDACVNCMGQRDIDLQNNILQNAGRGIVLGNGVSSITINNNIISDTASLAIDIGGWTSPTATNVSISNNVIHDTEKIGINLDGETSKCTVFNNKITGGNIGIDLGANINTLIAPSNVTLSDNFVHDYGFFGIALLDGTSYCNVINNTVQNGPIGIGFDALGTSTVPFDNLIDGNILSNNNYSNIVSVGAISSDQNQECYTNVFRRNNLTNAQSHNLMVWGYNLASFMQDIDNSNKANNKTIYYLTNRSNLEIDPSNLPDVGSLAIVNCTNCTVKDFDFSWNNDGLLLAGSTDCTLMNLTLANNRLYLFNESWPSIYGGLTLFDSSNNTLVGSRICNNNCGIWLCRSDWNTFYDNAFMGNDQQVISDRDSAFIKDNQSSGVFSTCTWNNTVEGNYWSDYNGTNANQNGIGDTPYIIDRNNTDYCPLVGRFESFTISTSSAGYQPLYVISNSTVSSPLLLSWLTSPYYGIQPGQPFIQFNATGENGTVGFCRLMIPRAVLNSSSYIVLVDSQPVNATELPVSNDTCVYLYFTYQHSTHEVVVTIPEVSPLILPLFAMATLLATVLYKRRQSNNSGCCACFSARLMQKTELSTESSQPFFLFFLYS